MNTIVETEYGKVQGIKHNNCLEFRGIPYAAPPIAERRFQAPSNLPPGKAFARQKHLPPPAPNPTTPCSV